MHPIRLSNMLCAGVIASIPGPTKLGKPGPGVPRCTDSTNPEWPDHKQHSGNRGQAELQNWYIRQGYLKRSSKGHMGHILKHEVTEVTANFA